MRGALQRNIVLCVCVCDVCEHSARECFEYQCMCIVLLPVETVHSFD